MKTPDIIKKLYKLPFWYDKESQKIFDAENNMVLDVRGWGRIQYMDNPLEKQDAFGCFVVDVLNETYETN